MPGKPFQSKLLPHLAFIRERRARRWSYARIAAALRDERGLSVAPSTIFSFVKVRARRPRTVLTLPEEAAARHDATGEASPAARHSPSAPGLPANAADFFTAELPASSNLYEQKPRPYRLDF